MIILVCLGEGEAQGAFHMIDIFGFHNGDICICVMDLHIVFHLINKSSNAVDPVRFIRQYTEAEFLSFLAFGTT